MAQTNTEIITSSGSQFVPQEKISYEEFLVKYDGQYAEYVEGKVIEPMSVTKMHKEITNFLSTLLQFFVEQKKLGKIYGEPYQMKMEIDDEIIGREPDIFFVSNEKSDRLMKQFYDGAADLVIEVISPESITRDTKDKFEEYEKAGVREYWIIDHERRTANFYGLDEENRYKLLLPDSDTKFESRAIEGLWIKTDWLWQEELPNLMDILKEWELI